MKKKAMYTLPEIAKMLHITLPEVENYVENGSLKIFKGSKKDYPLIMHVELMDFLRYYPHKIKKRKTAVREEKNPSQIKQLFPKETKIKRVLKAPKKAEKKRIKPVIKPISKTKITKSKPSISLIKEKQISKEKPKKVIQKVKSSKEKKTIYKPEIKKQNRKKKVIIQKEKKSVKKPLSFLSKIKHLIRKSSKKK